MLGQDRGSQLIFPLCLSHSVSLCFSVPVTLSFPSLCLRLMHTREYIHMHTLPYAPSSPLASGLSPGSFSLLGRLALVWAAAQCLAWLQVTVWLWSRHRSKVGTPECGKKVAEGQDPVGGVLS